MPLHRKSSHPFIRPSDIPALRSDLIDVSSVFNPGALRWRGRELLLLRVQTRGRTTVLLPAEVRDDVEFLGPPLDFGELEPQPAHIYDPRLTLIDDTIYLTCACDFPTKCSTLIAKSLDFASWELVAIEDRDMRNTVLFPEKIAGRFARLQRPNSATRNNAPATGSTIEFATSDDLLEWNTHDIVLEGRPQRWDEWVGSGPPPVKTREGWLHIYHGVATHFASSNIYQAGVVLLDLQDPSKVLSRGAFNILEPREAWELTGQVPNVVFPSGMTVEVDEHGFAPPNAELRVYYGAADTVVGMATASISELIADARFQG